MKRRRFMEYGILAGCSSCMIGAKTTLANENIPHNSLLVIEGVLEHIFQGGYEMPSAKEAGLVHFLQDTIMHPSYDKDIRAFIIAGADELNERTKRRFLYMQKDQKEKVLRAYEMTEYGESWLGRIMIVGMEGLFSDPIYGANPKERCWRALDTYGGQPRPKERYLGV